MTENRPPPASSSEPSEEQATPEQFVQDNEARLTEQYFNPQVKLVPSTQNADQLLKFGVVFRSMPGGVACVKPSEYVDLVSGASLVCGSASGAIVDIIGGSVHPIYYAKFDQEVEEGAEVKYIAGSLQKVEDFVNL